MEVFSVLLFAMLVEGGIFAVAESEGAGLILSPDRLRCFSTIPIHEKIEALLKRPLGSGCSKT